MPLVQIIEQHWAELVQALVFPLQVPASEVVPPPSEPPRPPSPPPPPSVNGRHSPPTQLDEQHSAPVVQTVPIGLHVSVWHRSKPPSAGRQGLLLQHWSLNWQIAPAAMQHGVVPV